MTDQQRERLQRSEGMTGQETELPEELAEVPAAWTAATGPALEANHVLRHAQREHDGRELHLHAGPLAPRARGQRPRHLRRTRLHLHQSKRATRWGVRAVSERCGCGLDDCELLAAGYPYCPGTGCGEHHRAPVATYAEPWCPVDFNAVLLHEAERKEEGSVSEETRRLVQSRFEALISDGETPEFRWGGVGACSCSSTNFELQIADEGRPFACNDCGLDFFKEQGTSSRKVPAVIQPIS